MDGSLPSTSAETSLFSCPECETVLSNVYNLNRHMKEQHEKQTFHQCLVCARKFKRKDNLQRHLSIHEHLALRQKRKTPVDQTSSGSATKRERLDDDNHVHACFVCDKHFASVEDLVEHTHSHTSKDDLTCPYCGKLFTYKRNKDRHIKTKHPESLLSRCPICDKMLSKTELTRHVVSHGSTSTQQPASSSQKQTEIGQKNIDQGEKQLLDHLPPDVKAIYENQWHSIKTHSRIGKVQSVYTQFWDPTCDSPRWDASLLAMFHQQTKRFKINFSHSFLLRNKQTSQLSFFHASHNNHRALDKPRLISSKRDFLSFLEDLNDQDILGQVQRERPDSRYTVQSIMATSFYINPLPDFPIGCACELPDFIRNNAFLHTLQRDEHNSFLYTDNLCFFRCLALHRGAIPHSLQSSTTTLYREWAGYPPSPDFPGITLLDLDSIESEFRVNVDVFEFDTSQSPPCITPLRRSDYKYTKTLRVLHYKHHFMYISDIDKLGHALACNNCGKLWGTTRQLNKHVKACQGSLQKESFPGGVYNPPPSILQTLDRYGISVKTDFVFPYRATFDFEVYFETDNLPQTKKQDSNTTFVAKHVPLSVSVASNVPGFEEPCCFLNEGDPQTMVNTMIDYLESMSDTSFCYLREQFDDTFSELSALEADSVNLRQIPAISLKKKLEDYLHELPVVGFNSSNYDLNVIKPYLIHRLVSLRANDGDDDDDDESNPLKFVVKRNNQYMCLATKKLKFLDIANFLAPGFSYSKYLKAFDVTEEKGHFCYEYITSLDRLKETSLPPHSAFHSSLKNTNITEEEYRQCQVVWSDHNMTSLKDFLIWYNNKDVVPFLQALQTQIDMYASLDIDLLKDGISVPGITLKYLFQTLPSDVYFSLCDDRRQDIHRLLRDNIVGGPSIIFHRYHEKDKTFIRDNPTKPVKSVQGYDANALYLYCLMQDMPTEHPIIRKKEAGFRPEYSDKYGRQAREWIEWVAHTNKTTIHHKFNGQEQALGSKRIRVDGWEAETRTAYQFHGCLFHGHDCHITRGKTVNPVNNKPLTELRENTRAITEYLRKEVGVTVVEMFECEWQRQKRTNPDITTFIQSRFPNIHHHFQIPVTERAILEAVQTDALFGLIECDIEVPSHLKEHFSELQPVFKNVSVTREDIGPHMRQYAETHKLLSQPRRSLIGSYFGKKILLATPLLKWYLQHGLVATNVTLVIEYTPKSCFQQFGKNVSDARRQGDSDPSKTILADTFKLLGNSAYGKTLTNIAKHHDIQYVSTDETPQLINDPRFQKLTELGADIVEVEVQKKNICWKLPLQIGYFVYQYAKLRMLEFYYDFLDKFVDRADFQLLEMDTDSLYMAISCEHLEDAVRPELRETFFKEYAGWFPGQACDTHAADYQRARNAHQSWDPSFCSDCLDRVRFDKRTPGLFKTEYTGDSFVGLCSKTYFCSGDEGDKLSCKGINKRHNALSLDTYQRVLDTRESGAGTNVGFRTDGKTMFTYSQTRKSLSYFYIKRIVADDGVSTLPILV